MGNKNGKSDKDYKKIGAIKELLLSDMESIFASIQDGIGVIDKDMKIIFVNQTAYKWYSENSSFIGKKCFEAFHKRSEPCKICPALRTLKTGRSASDIVEKHGKEVRKKDG